MNKYYTRITRTLRQTFFKLRGCGPVRWKYEIVIKSRISCLKKLETQSKKELKMLISLHSILSYFIFNSAFVRNSKLGWLWGGGTSIFYLPKVTRIGAWCSVTGNFRLLGCRYQSQLSNKPKLVWYHLWNSKYACFSKTFKNPHPYARVVFDRGTKSQ